MKILVNCTGFIGDILFASSVAKKLKAKYPGCYVIYQIPLPQPKLLLEQNPYIDRVVLPNYALEWPQIDMHITIPEVNQAYPATIQMQAAAGIEDQSLEFDVWTVPEYDTALDLKTFNKDKDFIFIAIQNDWAWRAYQCTSETLSDGIGAPHRNTDRIIVELNKNKRYVFTTVGFDRNTPSSHPKAQDPITFAKIASLIKKSDWFIGAEGGLSNLAAAVGTKCIITTDFIEQNYGRNGRLKKIEHPQMGPAVYYPDAGHVHLDPCLTDDEIIAEIKRIIG